MNYQSQNMKRHKDPFSVPPLPKSFYHPSPTKDVDDREAIRSPQRRSGPSTLLRQEEEFLRDGQTFRTSALPDIQTLRDLPDARSDLLRQNDVISSSHLNESWPESEMPSSVSASGNTSGVTLMTEDSESASPNIGDIVRGLGRLQQLPDSVDAKDNGRYNDTSRAGESVLQRYIERFRKSAPKSREERLNEKGDKPQFWWLNSSPGSRYDSAEVASRESIQQPPHVKDPSSKPQVKKQLTKEALMTLDEETFQLQNKADRLLSKSELSLASSGPIVSTEGLGSSTSVSISSVVEDKEPYRPTFAKGQEIYHRLEPKSVPRKDERSRLAYTTSSSPADDILTRWRLRRKMDEATTASSFRHVDKLPSMKPSQHPGLTSQLEEFRKKILSQKALVTHEDIFYERQRMAIMMDDIQQDGGILNEKISQAAVQPSEPIKDTVLVRMQKITGRRNSTSSMSFTEAATLNLKQDQTCPASSFSTNVDHNFSINNANFSDAELFRNSNQSLMATTLNKNNTALSYNHILNDMNLNNEHSLELSVDSFESQVICDPKKREFILGSSPTECYDHGKVVGKDDFITGKEMVEVEESIQDYSTAGRVREVNDVGTRSQGGKAKNIESKGNAEINKTEALKDSQINSKNGTQIDNGNSQITSEGEKYFDKVQRSVVKRGNENFYQYLEAEKPISEFGRETIKLGKKDKLIAGGCSSKSISSEEGGDNVRELMLDGSERRVTGDTRLARENRKCRTKTLLVKDRDEDSARSEVLADITNEDKQPPGKMSERPYSHRRNDRNKIVSNENKDLNISSEKLHPKSGPVQVSSNSPRSQSSRSRVCLSEQQQVHHAVGQAVTDHLFDGSTLLSSVDSWASMFPQSPGLSHSQHGSASSPISSTPSRGGNVIFDSTTAAQNSPDHQADEEYESEGEYNDDPLLLILRQQRDLYLKQLRNVEQKLQDIDT